MLTRQTIAAVTCAAVCCGVADAQDCNGNLIPDACELAPFNGALRGKRFEELAPTARLASSQTQFVFTGSFSVDFWICRPADGPVNGLWFTTGLPGTASESLHIGFRSNGTFTFAFWDDDLNTPIGYPPDGQWHHWACTYDRNTRQRIIYRDGVQVASDISAGPCNSTGGWTVGGWINGGSSAFGVIDSLSINARPLASTEVADIAANGGFVGDVRWHYRFDESSPEATSFPVSNPLTPTGPVIPFTYLPDCNENGIPDECDIIAGTSQDCDGDGIPDECAIASGLVPDCNANGIPDGCDFAAGTVQDCDGDGVPDECTIASGLVPDCNANGIPDGCDLLTGVLNDCDEDGEPDECLIMAGIAPDCNDNLVPDLCDVISGLDTDCNDDGILDSCEIMDGTSPDCNGNGLPDGCDLASGTSQDANLNGVPDECECPADVNGDGVASPADFTAWLACFNDPMSAPFCDRADVNSSGATDPADFTAWLAAFNAGCP